MGRVRVRIWPDKNFSPEDWFVTTSGAMEDPTAFSFANSEELLSRILNGDDEAMTEGDKMGTVGVFPAAWSDFLGIPTVDDMSPEEMVEAMTMFFFEDDPEGLLIAGDADVVEKEGEPVVGIIPISREATAVEGLWFAYSRDDYIIFGFAAAYTGEFDDDYQALAIDIILSYEITITAEELMTQVMEE